MNEFAAAAAASRRVWSAAVGPNGYGVGIATRRSRARLTAVSLSGNNLGQVVHIHVPLSPSSIIWCRSRGGDAVRLGR